MIRLGTVPYLNAWPLLEGLEEMTELVAEPPSALARALSAGRYDAALVPVVELLRNPRLQVISNSAIATLGPVLSVLLFLRRSPHRLASVVLDPHSATSQILTRVLLRDRFGVVPCTEEDHPLRAWDRGTGDAVLAIGDLALEMRTRDLPHLDLGTEWFLATGLPFVFAVWAAEPEALDRHPSLPDILDAARERGLASKESILARGGARLGLPLDLVRVYVERAIRYRLAAPEAQGLQRFLATARAFVAPRGASAAS